jgi:hypothetical protein
MYIRISLAKKVHMYIRISLAKKVCISQYPQLGTFVAQKSIIQNFQSSILSIAQNANSSEHPSLRISVAHNIAAQNIICSEYHRLRISVAQNVHSPENGSEAQILLINDYFEKF